MWEYATGSHGSLNASADAEADADGFPRAWVANPLSDKLKEHAVWENEVVADIKAERTDIHGIYDVQSGDTLSKIAKRFLGDANRYRDLFNANSEQLKDPDLIRVGQKPKIPNR